MLLEILYEYWANILYTKHKFENITVYREECGISCCRILIYIDCIINNKKYHAFLTTQTHIANRIWCE